MYLKSELGAALVDSSFMTVLAGASRQMPIRCRLFPTGKEFRRPQIRLFFFFPNGDAYG